MNSEINLKSDFSITLLSPIHIGNGNSLQLSDFFLDQKQKTIHIIDHEKLFSLVRKKNLNFLEIIENRQYQARYGNENIFSLEKFINNTQIDINEISKYSIPALIDWTKKRESKIIIREFIKNPIYPYIPGSSIKGAIRTALFWDVINSNPSLKNKLFNILNKLDPRKRRMQARFADNEIEQIIFGKDPHHDILRFLQISDSTAVGYEQLEVTEIHVIGNPSTIPIYTEVLKKGSQLNAKIKLDSFYSKDLVKNQLFSNHVLSNYMTLTKIFEVCNNFSGAILQKELEYKNYPNEVKLFYEELNEMIKNCKKNEAILRFSWGSGWYSTTIGTIIEHFSKFWELRKKYKLGMNPKTKRYVTSFPKTRRITVTNFPLGWIKIKL